MNTIEIAKSMLVAHAPMGELMGEIGAERDDLFTSDVAAIAQGLLDAVAALEKIEEWQPGSMAWCQGCYGETKDMAERALSKLKGDAG